MNLAAVNVTFSAASEEGANGFIELLRENVDLAVTIWHDIAPKEVLFGNGTKGGYWIGYATIIVNAENLNNCLVQIDSVKHGFVPRAEEVLTQVFRDLRVEIDPNQIGDIVPLIQQNQYLHNRVQEMERAMELLEQDNQRLTAQAEGFESQITGLMNQYREIQTVLYDHINIYAMAKVLRDVVEKVDENILDDFPIQKVH